MFTASAELYDLIYSGSRDYASEAAQIAGLIQRDHPTAQRVLDVAFREAGLKVDYYPKGPSGRGLYLARAA